MNNVCCLCRLIDSLKARCRLSWKMHKKESAKTDSVHNQIFSFNQSGSIAFLGQTNAQAPHESQRSGSIVYEPQLRLMASIEQAD